jgi:hypothetical protein
MKILDWFFTQLGYSKKRRPRPHRLCSVCGMQIKKHDRWHYVSKEPTHWNCANPTEEPNKKHNDSEQIEINMFGLTGNVPVEELKS